MNWQYELVDNKSMIQNTILLIILASLALAQDALINSKNPFVLVLDEQITYHQTFLIEVDPNQHHTDWNTIFAYQSAFNQSKVYLEFMIVHKQFPERDGHLLSKCTL